MKKKEKAIVIFAARKMTLLTYARLDSSSSLKGIKEAFDVEAFEGSKEVIYGMRLLETSEITWQKSYRTKLFDIR